MKKLFLTVAVASVMLSACKKDEAVAPTSTSEAPKAIVQGKVRADLNLSNNTTGTLTDKESAPDGTKVIATATHNGNTYRYETTVTSGAYKLEIPCNNAGVDVTIRFSDFVADETQPTGSTPSSISRVWKQANVDVAGLVGGVTRVQDVEYTY